MCWKLGGGWRDVERSSRGCSRADLPTIAWDVAPERLGFYLGRAEDPRLDGDPENLTGDWERPSEPLDEGCPGGFQRCRFVLSLARFYRRRDAQGGRVANPLLDRCDDWLVLQGVLFREQQEDLCSAERARLEEDVRKRTRG